ncbi:MAG: serine/threonine-protein kinase, partial [Candidatus Hydrogenedentales bacterium]
EFFFYTMEFVKGRTLREWMARKKRFGLGSTVRVLSLLCYALEHAHRFTVHRDLSPENVMVTPAGEVKLLDFGLAKLLDTQASFTRIGVSLGKQHYSAPEQRMDAKNADHRADLFSLGVLFYEMLSGKTPVPDVPLTDLAPDLPQECDTFVDKAIHPKPDARFQSAAEMRHALNHVYRIAQMSPEDVKAERARSNLDRQRKDDRGWRMILIPIRFARELLSRR